MASSAFRLALASVTLVACSGADSAPSGSPLNTDEQWAERVRGKDATIKDPSWLAPLLAP